MLASGYGLIASLDPARGEHLRRVVAGAGLEPLVTRDGDEARSALRRRGAPGLMVTELSLPRFDGFRLLEALRRVASVEETPAIVMSAFAPLRDAAERLRRELGISAILPPRASASAVQRTVKRALNRVEFDLGAPLIEAAEISTPSPVRGAGAIGSRAGEPALRRVLGPLLEEALRGLNVPVGFVALLDGGLPWLASHVGLAADAPEALLLSAEVTAANDLLVIPDASHHPLFAYDLRPVMQGFAATPIVTSRGEMVGALGVADDGVLLLGPEEMEELGQHARRLAGAIELAAGAAAPASGSSQELATVLAHLDSGVALLDGEQRLVLGNAALAELCGVDPARFPGMARAELVAAFADLGADGHDIERRLRVGKGSYAARDELELARPRRRVLRWVARPLRLGGEPAQLEIFDDITAEVDLARERELLARTDWLTGLVNRRGGEEAIAREVARARRLGSSLCFALFDIDNFKLVNDARGHPAGDELLKSVAQVLHGAVRASDLAVRWGGDELLVVLPAIHEGGGRIFADRVRKRVAALEGGVTISCGVAELGRFEDVSAAIKRADARLYEAKSGGRNRVR